MGIVVLLVLATWIGFIPDFCKPITTLDGRPVSRLALLVGGPVVYVLGGAIGWALFLKGFYFTPRTPLQAMSGGANGFELVGFLVMTLSVGAAALMRSEVDGSAEIRRETNRLRDD